jgi:Protein of unknown function (DUF2474)
MATQGKTQGSWRSRFGWLILIWAASVGALGIVAFGMKLLMRAAGLGA